MTSIRILRYERKLWRSGVEVVAGVDEAGVGPMVVVPPRSSSLPKRSRAFTIPSSSRRKGAKSCTIA